jgi:hypothetical protein
MDEQRLRVFENKVLRRIFGPKKEEVVGGWRRLCNNGFCNLYASPIIRVIKSRRMKWAGEVACNGAVTNAYKIFVGKLDGKRSFRGHMCKWKDNIIIDIR